MHNLGRIERHKHVTSSAHSNNKTSNLVHNGLLAHLCSILFYFNCPPLNMATFQETTLPSDHQTACPLVYGVLKNPETRPVIIMVDAINQVSHYSCTTSLN